jgi:hypothetical protein
MISGEAVRSSEYEVVKFVQFEEVSSPTGGEKRLFLVVAYKTGFQVWNADDPNALREAVSVRGRGVLRMCAVWPCEHPFVAIVHEDTPSVVDWMAITGGAAAAPRPVPLSGPALCLRAGRGGFLVADVGAVMDVVKVTGNSAVLALSLPCLAPGPTMLASSPDSQQRRTRYAVGDRWLAYPAAEAPPDEQDGAMKIIAATVISGVTTGVTALARGVGALGLMGATALASYWNDPQQPQQSPSQSQSQSQSTSPSGHHQRQAASIGSSPPLAPTAPPAHPPAPEPDQAGTVMVRDLRSREVVAHFRAHSHSLACMQFDPSGTLLATASADGHNVHVYALAAPNTAKGEVVKLYHLHRGSTGADIVDLSFGSDSRWLAASTSFGITHFFAICPGGGPASARTHMPEHRQLHAVLPAGPPAAAAQDRTPCVTASALAKIRQSAFVQDPAGPLPPVLTYFLQPARSASATSLRRVLSVTHGRDSASGALLGFHTLAPALVIGEAEIRKGNTEGRDVDAMEVRTSLDAAWDVARPAEWEEVPVAAGGLPFTAHQPVRRSSSAPDDDPATPDVDTAVQPALPPWADPLCKIQVLAADGASLAKYAAYETLAWRPAPPVRHSGVPTQDLKTTVSSTKAIVDQSALEAILRTVRSEVPSGASSSTSSSSTSITANLDQSSSPTAHRLSAVTLEDHFGSPEEKSPAPDSTSKHHQQKKKKKK